MADMANLTYGRSAKGTEKILSDLERDIETMKRVLSSNDYAEILLAVRTNWSGADANAFIKKLNESRQELAQCFDDVKAQMQMIINEDYKNFVQDQNKIADTINSQIKKIQ